MKHDAEYLILGAGLTGLACGLELVRKGAKVILLEQEDAVGGLSRSLNKDGFVFDFGGHRFLPKNKKIEHFVSQLFNGNGMITVDRKSQIYIKDKFLSYPPDPRDVLQKFGFFTCADCLAKGIYARLRHGIRKGREDSLKDWLLNRFGSKLYEIYFGPYSAKLWGREPKEISADWAGQRISVSSISMALRHFVSSNHPATYAKNFLYPKGGIGEIARRISSSIQEGAGEIFLQRKIKQIIRSCAGLLVKTSGPGQQEGEFLAKKIISTIPLDDFIRNFQPKPPEKVISAANRLKYRSLRFLNLIIKGARITDNTWIYVPEKKYIFFRIQELLNWHPDNCPEKTTSLTLEIACDKGGVFWRMPDEELFRQCIRDLEKMGIRLKGRVELYFSSFAEHGYPVYSLDYKDHLKPIYYFIREEKDIVICGRQGLFRYVNMDQAIEMGLSAAAAFSDQHKKESLLRFHQSPDYLEKGLYWRRNEL
jgi:protoporphyrinogen oxidase